MEIFPIPKARCGITIEIGVASVEDALTAKKGGAHRLELSAALALGGLTPSLGLLCEVRRAVTLPLVVMIRPRAGGFCYSAAEFEVMLHDAETAFAHGADGIAFGVLREDGSLDTLRCRQLATLAKGRQAVFHRAFDALPDPVAALAQLAELGVCRVMTSGGCETAVEGAVQIARLLEGAGDQIEILPAGKINSESVLDLLDRTDCNQVHAALRALKTDPYVRTSASVPPANPLESFEATCLEEVRELRRAIEVWEMARSLR